MSKYRAISQRFAKDNLNSPDTFKGGAIITRNGQAELFIQTAKEREQEEIAMQQQQEAIALVKLVVMSQQDVKKGDTVSAQDALKALGIKHEG